jgi:uncharacterized surface anchored protein
LTKTDASSSGARPLRGAEFSLVPSTNDGKPLTDEEYRQQFKTADGANVEDDFKPAESDEYGKVSFYGPLTDDKKVGLPSGHSYLLHEVSAPLGYINPDNYYLVEITVAKCPGSAQEGDNDGCVIITPLHLNHKKDGDNTTGFKSKGSSKYIMPGYSPEDYEPKTGTTAVKHNIADLGSFQNPRAYKLHIEKHNSATGEQIMWNDDDEGLKATFRICERSGNADVHCEEYCTPKELGKNLSGLDDVKFDVTKVYRFYETKAPEGYVADTGFYELQFSDHDNTPHLTYKVNDNC